jgi:superoxide reductase
MTMIDFVAGKKYNRPYKYILWRRVIMKVYKCAQCGNIISMIHVSGVPVMCCGKKMEEIVPNTVEASEEKHVPVVNVFANEIQVLVGEVEHPMVEEHFIEWIVLETEQGSQCKKLLPGEKPMATFKLNGDKAVAAYAYCNLHGLWKTEIVEKPVCDLKPLDLDAKENYVVCKCNSVSYFDILEALQSHSSIENLLDVFEDVKNTTHCSTGCGGCHEKVIAIISEALSGNKN